MPVVEVRLFITGNWSDSEEVQKVENMSIQLNFKHFSIKLNENYNNYNFYRNL